MRGHGVPNFPDPGAGGGIKIPVGSGAFNPASPGVQPAERACKHLLPGGGPPLALSEQQKLQAVKFAQCMRAHGVPGFPDPTFQGGGLLRPSRPNGVDPNSPAFQKAAKSCGNPV